MKAIYKKLVTFFFNILYGEINTLENEEILFNKTKLSEKGVDLFLYEIENGRVFTDCNTNVAYIKNNQIISAISYQQNAHEISDVKFNSTLVSGTPKFKKKIDASIFSTIQGKSGENYFHWLYDIIPKFGILEENKLLDKIDYYYVPQKNNFVIETLNLFNIKKDKLINSNLQKHIEVKKIYAFKHLWLKEGKIQDQFQNIPNWIIEYLRDKFLNYKTKKINEEKIFIDRSDSIYNHCKIQNNKEIINYLENQNFKIYRLSDFNFLDQINIFNSAKIVIGAHGAGFANVSFCEKGTDVIEIFPENHKNKMTNQISKFLNLNYKRVETSGLPNFDNEGDIYLDLNTLKKILKE